MNGYSMWRKKDAVRGGYSGLPAIEPGNSAESRLIRLVAGLEENLLMPPAGGPLSPEEVGVLRAWIDQGLSWPASRQDSARKESNEWLEMDYGPMISASITVREPEDPRADKGPENNIAYKAQAVSLTPDDQAGIVFDTELLRYSVGWSGGFLKLTGTVFDWKHGPHPYIEGKPIFETPVEPGWARDGSFQDPRKLGFGNLPEDWGRYRGHYVHGNRIVFEYEIGAVRVLDNAEYVDRDGAHAIVRRLEIAPGQEPLLLQAASTDVRPVSFGDSMARAGDLRVAVEGDADLRLADDRIRVEIPPSFKTRSVTVVLSPDASPQALERLREADHEPLSALTKGGPARYPQTIATRGEMSTASGPYVVDRITLPHDNPWKSWMRPGDFDFFDGEDRAAMSTWSGDVWIVDGVDQDLNKLTWKRYATGFYQPQGVEVVDGKVYVLDRNQVTILHDLNADNEADYYENFNNDFQATHHFHEFTFSLERDREGNFYFSKAARHALPAKVDHHGVIMKLDPAGENLEILCRGFRVPNGVALGPNGEITTSDQEGHWIPSTPVTLCEPGGYYGYAWGGGVDPAKADDFDWPITYLPISVDNSGGGQAWVPDDRWGPYAGHLVHSSFGRGKIFIVLMEKVDGLTQGGAFEMPVDFDTGLMRPDFRDDDGQLYVTGLYGWGTRKKATGGFYRVRYTGEPVALPIELHSSRQNGVSITFTQPLDRSVVRDPANYSVKRWNYKRTRRYGSDLFKLNGEQGTEEMTVRSARLSADGKTVSLELADLREVQQMQITFRLKTTDGRPVQSQISHSIHRLPEQDGQAFTAR